MRPVNNIVDITNYVLLERGHPLHAFDFDRLHEGKIVVARARPGQKIVTLDGVERELDEEMLLINDGAGPVAIAGVMGGLDSEISASTQASASRMRLFPARLRAPHFEKARSVHRGQLSLRTRRRLERPARRHRPHLLLDAEAGGGRIAGSVQDVYPEPMAPVEIELSLRACRITARRQPDRRHSSSPRSSA